MRKVYVETKLATEIKVSETDSPIVALDYRLVDFGDRPKSYLAVADTWGPPIFLPQRQRPICSHGAALPKSIRSLCPFQKKRSILDSQLLMIPATISFLLIVLGTYFRYDVHNENKPQLAETLKVTIRGLSLQCSVPLLGGPIHSRG